MNANWKRMVVVTALVSPIAVMAGDATADQHRAAKERSNHETNKKAIAMEAK